MFHSHSCHIIIFIYAGVMKWKRIFFVNGNISYIYLSGFDYWHVKYAPTLFKQGYVCGTVMKLGNCIWFMNVRVHRYSNESWGQSASTIEYRRTGSSLIPPSNKYSGMFENCEPFHLETKPQEFIPFKSNLLGISRHSNKRKFGLVHSHCTWYNQNYVFLRSLK